MQTKCTSSIMALTVNGNNNRNNNNIISATSLAVNNNNNNHHNNTIHNNNSGSSLTIASHDESNSSNNSCQSNQVPASFLSSSVGVEINISQSNSKRSIIVDLLLILLVIFPILIFEYVIEPFERGFFCNDESIRYPYYNNTISTLNLGLFVLLFPPCIMLIIEYLHNRQHSTIWQLHEFQITHHIPATCRCLPNYVMETIRQFVFYIFGLLMVLNATEIGKFTIGRLRPHFYAVCQPRMLDGSSCADKYNEQRYIERYYCQSSLDMGSKFTSADLREARLSFPSGHSSLIWYSMLYLVIYLQYRTPKYGFSRLSLCFVQFLFMGAAWFTALSRIMDNFHHWSDVLIGGILGALGAVLTVHFIARLASIKSTRKHVRVKQTPSPFILREVSVVTTT